VLESITDHPLAQQCVKIALRAVEGHCLAHKESVGLILMTTDHAAIESSHKMIHSCLHRVVAPATDLLNSMSVFVVSNTIEDILLVKGWTFARIQFTKLLQGVLMLFLHQATHR
jgi:hypothetical protein